MLANQKTFDEIKGMRFGRNHAAEQKHEASIREFEERLEKTQSVNFRQSYKKQEENEDLQQINKVINCQLFIRHSLNNSFPNINPRLTRFLKHIVSLSFPP